LSELSNDPPIQEESVKLEDTTSPWTMLITMVLLIAGFIMASVMMLHYIPKDAAVDSKVKKESINLSSLMEQGKKYATQLKNPEETEPAEQPQKATESEEAKLSKLFSSRGDKVKWPKLKLTGFGTSSEGDGGFAIINGKQIHPGQLIDGKAKLDQIRSNDVVVEYMGETKTLTVDVKH
jgi:hypothetical protein